MAKIGISRLKTIIREELQNIYEGADEDAASKIMSGASKLLNAIESFKETASEKVKAEVGSNLDGVEQLLKRIVASPLQYVDVTAPGPKVVSLKPQKKEVV
jgi:hypothetical protein